MSPVVLGALIAGVTALLTVSVNALLENRRADRQAWEQEAARAAAAAAQEREQLHQRVERRYEDRLQALSEYLTEADHLMAVSLEREYESHGSHKYPGPPGDFLDGPELEPMVAELRRRQSRVELLASERCRSAASAFEKQVTDYVWSWKNYTEVQTTRTAFINAARADLALTD